MTWEEVKVKYQDTPFREEMTDEQEREFVADCFDCYEAEGFAKVFWSMGNDFCKYHGQSFEVIGRTPVLDGDNNGADLECLPMWNIRFEDGYEISAYPDEIILREMRENGCPEEYLEGEVVKVCLKR